MIAAAFEKLAGVHVGTGVPVEVAVAVAVAVAVFVGVLVEVFVAVFAGVEVAVGVPAAQAGRVRFIAKEASFTPYFALTQKDRGNLVFVAEVDLTDAAARNLPVGIPVEIRPADERGR